MTRPASCWAKKAAGRIPSPVSGRQCPAASPTRKTPRAVAGRSPAVRKPPWVWPPLIPLTGEGRPLVEAFTPSGATYESTPARATCPAGERPRVPVAANRGIEVEVEPGVAQSGARPLKPVADPRVGGESAVDATGQGGPPAGRVDEQAALDGALVGDHGAILDAQRRRDDQFAVEALKQQPAKGAVVEGAEAVWQGERDRAGACAGRPRRGPLRSTPQGPASGRGRGWSRMLMVCPSPTSPFSIRANATADQRRAVTKPQMTRPRQRRRRSRHVAGADRHVRNAVQLLLGRARRGEVAGPIEVAQQRAVLDHAIVERAAIARPAGSRCARHQWSRTRAWPR